MWRTARGRGTRLIATSEWHGLEQCMGKHSRPSERVKMGEAAEGWRWMGKGAGVVAGCGNKDGMAAPW